MNLSQNIEKLFFIILFRQEEMCPYWKCHPIDEQSIQWLVYVKNISKLLNSVLLWIENWQTECRRTCLGSFPIEGDWEIQEWTCLLCSDFVSEQVGGGLLESYQLITPIRVIFLRDDNCHLLLQKWCFTPIVYDKRQIHSWLYDSPYYSNLLFVILKPYMNLA